MFNSNYIKSCCSFKESFENTRQNIDPTINMYPCRGGLWSFSKDGSTFASLYLDDSALWFQDEAGFRNTIFLK